MYDYFVSSGCKYAPVEIAMKFSLESVIPECEMNLDNCFGFHGKGDSWVFKDKGHLFIEKMNLLNNM